MNPAVASQILLSVLALAVATALAMAKRLQHGMLLVVQAVAAAVTTGFPAAATSGSVAPEATAAAKCPPIAMQQRACFLPPRLRNVPSLRQHTLHTEQ